MTGNIQNLTNSAQRKVMKKVVDAALFKVKKDREESLLKVVDLANLS